MNLPNKLTIARIIMIPFFLFFVLNDGPGFVYIAAALFVVASLTDMLDGKIARKYNLVTTFGKFADPLADKILVTSALICLVGIGKIGSVVTIIIIAREFIVTGFRTIAMSEGKVIAAGKSGKLKTVTQLVAITAVILTDKLFFFAPYIPTVLIYISAIITVYSGAEYIIKNKEIIKIK